MDTLYPSEKNIRGIYELNPFVVLLNMKLDRLGLGEADLSMPVPHQLTNFFGMLHGGALASLADTTMGVSCVTLGKRVMTLDMNINFIRGGQEGETLQSRAKVIHNGNKTLVVENEVVNQEGILLAKARGTFFVVGQFEFE